MDDCDLFSSGDSVQDSFKQMQQSLRHWEALVEVTGGCLVPYKSSWHLVDITWKQGQWTCFDPQSAKFQLDAKLHTGGTGLLTTLKLLEAMEMFGVYLTPMGNQEMQLSVMRKSAKQWADCIWVGHLKRHEIRLALHTTMSKKISPACTESISNILHSYYGTNCLDRITISGHPIYNANRFMVSTNLRLWHWTG